MLATRHIPNGEPNVLIKSLPRSGSTWLMELILTQPGFTSFNEPFNLDKPVVRQYLGMGEWKDLHAPRNEQRMCNYVLGLCSGAIRDSRFDRPSPLSEFYRPVTHRAVLKVITAGEEYMDSLSRACNGRVVLLLRHPIPVSRSRKRLPKLDTMLESEFCRHFDAAQLALAARIVRSGDEFSRGVLDWCMHMAVALRSRKEAWSVVTYEQLVLDPAPAISLMAKKLELPEPERLLRRLAVPSQSTRLSDARTRSTLQTIRTARDPGTQRWLVERWREDITDEELNRAAELLETFGLTEVYSASVTMPEDGYWIS